MKILMLSRDKNVFDQNSDTGRRMRKYGASMEKLVIYVLNRPFKILKLGQQTKGFDLVTAQDPFETGLIGWLIAKILGIPLQLQIHTDFMSPYFWRESLLNKIRVLLAKFLIPRANEIRVVSERIKNSLLSSRITRSSSQIIVQPIFVDVEKIKNAPIKTDLHKKYPQFDFIILMASRFTKEKNIEMAIEAIHNANNKLNANHAKPKIGLIIVGAGPEKDNLKFKINNLKLFDNVIIEDWCDDLISYYKTADLFLLTSNYEGYGMTVIEALAADCSVIMTDVGCAGEAVKNGENGTVISVGDTQKLTEAILAQI